MIDVVKITFFGMDVASGLFISTEVVFDACIVGASVIVVPRVLLPANFDEVIVVLRDGAVRGAVPLAACGADAQPHPAYAAAAAELPAVRDIALAMRLRLSTRPQQLSRLYRALAAAPALEVQSVEARALESFGYAATAGPSGASMAPTAAAGVLALPEYRDVDGLTHADATGVLRTVGHTLPGFVVTLPRAGTAPFPLVLYQHAGGGLPTDILNLAGPLSEAGFALVAIDLPEHGNRAPTAGPTGDAALVDFEDLAVTRSSVEQAVADQLAVLTGLDALNEALMPIFGASTSLDGRKMFVMGSAVGGVSASITFATDPEVRGSALFAGGGGLPELASGGVYGAALTPILPASDPDRAVVLAFGDVLLNPADPTAYARAIEDRHLAPRPALFFEAVGDTSVAALATENWARAFGADLALPRDHAVPGMLELPLPASANFVWDPGWVGATRVLVQAPMADVAASARHDALVFTPYTQAMVARCFQALLITGRCEATDTGWARY